ncbi:hypothetical protein D3C78_1616210 [compost metagenome]
MWRRTRHEDYLLPPITPTTEEADELAVLMDGINEYVVDAELRIILGVDPIDAYDEMVKQLKLLGIERILEIKQAAYQRYVNR